MAAKVIWSPQTLTDLELMVAHVRQGGEIVARRIGTELISAAESLAAFPEKGRAFPNGDRPDARELIHHPTGSFVVTMPRVARYAFSAFGMALEAFP